VNGFRGRRSAAPGRGVRLSGHGHQQPVPPGERNGGEPSDGPSRQSAENYSGRQPWAHALRNEMQRVLRSFHRLVRYSVFR